MNNIPPSNAANWSSTDINMSEIKESGKNQTSFEKINTILKNANFNSSALSNKTHKTTKKFSLLSRSFKSTTKISAQSNKKNITKENLEQIFKTFDEITSDRELVNALKNLETQSTKIAVKKSNVLRKSL